MRTTLILCLGLVVALGTAPLPAAESRSRAELPPLVRSARSGAWSAPGTWEGGKVPPAGARVQVRSGHTVSYDLKSDRVIRSLHL